MPLSHTQLLQLKRWNTPTIYNGWEQITSRDNAHDGFNLEETHDFMPQMGPMVGYAVTVCDRTVAAEAQRSPALWRRLQGICSKYAGTENRRRPRLG